MQIDILGFWGGYPTRGGATSGYLISTDEGKILIDCGSGVMSKLSLYMKAEDLEGVVLSHLHYDHMADVGILQYALVGALRNERRKEKMLVLSPAKPEKMWHQIQSEQTNHIKVEDLSSYTIAGAKIEFHAVQHTIPCYAIKVTYRGKTFVYSADTSYLDSLVGFAKDAHLFFCEATICEGSTHTTGKGHMDAKDAATIAKKANVNTLILTHLPSDADFEQMKEEAKSIFGKEVYLASEKSTYIL